jgi:hypothetical protein
MDGESKMRSMFMREYQTYRELGNLHSNENIRKDYVGLRGAGLSVNGRGVEPSS